MGGGIATEAQGQGGRGEGGLGWPVGLAIIGIQVKPIWAGATHCLKDAWNLKKGFKKTKSNKKKKRTEEHEKHMQQKQSVV